MDAKAIDPREIRFLSALLYNFDLSQFTVLPVDRLTQLLPGPSFNTPVRVKAMLQRLMAIGFIERGPRVLEGYTYRIRPAFLATPESVAEHARQCRASAERLTMAAPTANVPSVSLAPSQYLIERRTRTPGKHLTASHGWTRNLRKGKRAQAEQPETPPASLGHLGAENEVGQH